MTPGELDTLLERVYRAIWRDLLRALDVLRQHPWIPAIQRMLLDNSLDAVFRSAGWIELENALGRLPGRLGPIREASWELAGVQLPRPLRADAFVRVALPRFALERPDVQRALAAQDLSRIRGISSTTQETIRELLATGLREGTHPRTLAREIQQQVGLTRQQQRALLRYRERLEKAGKPPEQLERMVDRFAQRQRRQRAETIARTEVIRAQSEGRRLQWERLVQEGRLRGDEWEQEWLTSRDERTCPVCWPMHGQRQPIGGMFDSSVGPVLAPPVHPRCRCTVRLVQRGFRAGEDPTPVRDRRLASLGSLGRG